MGSENHFAAERDRALWGEKCPTLAFGKGKWA